MTKRRNGLKFCPRRFGLYGVCRARLEYETTREGGVVVHCPACERMARGLCVDCPRWVEGAARRSRRCSECKKKERTRAVRRHEKRDPEARQRNQRKCFDARQKDPKKRQETLDYKRAWRKANPELVRGQKRREGLRQSPQSAKYHAAYRAAHPQKHVAGLGHTCPCGVQLTGKTRKCDECKGRDRRVAEAFLVKRRGRGRRTDLEKSA